MYDCSHECEFDTDRTSGHLLHHITNGIYTALSNEDMHLLPTRTNFLDGKLSAVFNEYINAQKPVMFMPTSIHDSNDFVDGKKRYQVYIFGILPCGSKTCVVLRNIPVVLTIKVPPEYNAKSFQDYIRSHMMSKGVFYNGYEIMDKYPMHGFQKDPSIYIKYSFNTTYDRKKFMGELSLLSRRRVDANITPIQTADDDEEKDYFLKIARDYRFRTGSWNRIEGYKVITGTKARYTLAVDVRDYKKLSKSRKRALSAPTSPLESIMDKDPTCVMMWDIETYRTIQNGMVPTRKDNDFTIFMICATFFWQYTDVPFLRVCFVNTDIDYACKQDGVLLTIHCSNDISVVKNFIKVMGLIQPDITGAFNGGRFDTPLVAEILQRNNLLKWAYNTISMIPAGDYYDEKKIFGRMFRKAIIKIDADSNCELECVFNVPGILDIDVLPVFLKLYPRAEVRLQFSLNFFLMKNGIDLKDDMPYKVMFKIYERSLKYKSAPKKCHCGTNCAHCAEIVPELDCIMIGKSIDGLSNEYSDEQHPDIIDKCCYCGKRKRNINDMSLVAHYCIVDCLRPQQLCLKRTILMDKRELCTMSFTTLRNSFYNADGMRVRNLLGSYCNKFNIAFSNARCHKQKNEKNHFPGAWVFPPVRGLNNRRPITGLDFNSLYPSIMMAFNLSPDMLVLDKAYADTLRSEGYSLYEIVSFTYETGEKKGTEGNKIETAKGWTVRHNGVLKHLTDMNIVSGYIKYTTITAMIDNEKVTIKYRSDEPVSEETKYALDKLEKKGVKLVKTYSREPVPGRPALKQERMGLFSYVVKKLFDKRVPIKRQFVQLSGLIEELELGNKTHAKYKDENDIILSLSLHDLEFRKNKVNAKQYAIKILANTFYGESGNYMSPVYNLHIAGGVTSAGQANIKAVAEYVIGKKYGVQYGDTDSLYLTCPDEYYKEADDEYNESTRTLEEKERYWYKMVDITMKVMSDLVEEVSDFLLDDNGTLFLKMAYEEVGFPTVLCGKKKYYMIPHQKEINFRPKELFIKGIDIIKQGQTAIAKELGGEFMRESLAIDNNRELVDLAHDKLRKFYSCDWDVHKFVLNGRYKPGKKNVPVQKFVARMKTLQTKYKNDPALYALYSPPDPGDRFAYVVVEVSQKYTLAGTMIKIQKGDKMEYLSVYLASQNTSNPLKIDLDYYMSGSILGLFARFIAYHDMFQPPAGQYDTSDKDQYSDMDKHCVNAASSYLTKFCHTITGFDVKERAVTGRGIRKRYNALDKAVSNDLIDRYGPAGEVLLMVDRYREADSTKSVSTEIVNKILDINKIDYNDTDYGYKLIHYMDSEGVNIHAVKRIYALGNNAMAKMMISMATSAINDIRNQMFTKVNGLIDILIKHEKSFMSLLEDVNVDKDAATSDDIKSVNLFTDGEIEILDTFHKWIREIKNNYTLISQMKGTLECIELIRAEMIGSMTPVITQQSISSEVSITPVMPDYVWQ